MKKPTLIGSYTKKLIREGEQYVMVACLILGLAFCKDINVRPLDDSNSVELATKQKISPHWFLSMNGKIDLFENIAALRSDRI